MSETRWSQQSESAWNMCRVGDTQVGQQREPGGENRHQHCVGDTMRHGMNVRIEPGNMCRVGDTAHVSSPGGTAIVVSPAFSLGEAERRDTETPPPPPSNLGEVRLWYQISPSIYIYGRICKQIHYHNRASPKLVYLLVVHYHRVKPLRG